MPRTAPEPGDLLYALGNLIQARRVARGLTQRDLANLVGVGFTTAQYWEQGRHDPGIKNLKRIAQCCDMALSQFLSPLDNHRVPPPRNARIRNVKRKRAADAADA